MADPTETPEVPAGEPAESKPNAKPKSQPKAAPVPTPTPESAAEAEAAAPTTAVLPAAPVAPAAESAPAAPVAEPAPLVAPRADRRRLVRPLIIAGGSLIVVVIGLVIAYAVLAAQHAPGKTVTAFLDQLVAGHAEAAAAQLDPKPTTNDALLNDDVYGAAETGHITKYSIVKSSEKGDTAVVTAKLTDATHTWTETIHLDSTGRDLLWNVWAVDGHHLARIDVNLSAPAGLPLTVNGVDLGDKGINGDGSFAAFPGVYQLAPATDDKALFSSDTQKAEVKAIGETGNDAVKFKVSLTDAGVTAANAALATFLNGCISQHVLKPAGGCGYSIIDNGTVFTTITWTLTKRPVASFEGYDGTGFFVTTTTTGIISFRAENSRVIGTSTFNNYKYFGEILIDDKGVATFESDYKK